MLAKVIHNAFGLRCEIKEIKLKRLPVYMLSGRGTYKVSLGECSFVLVEIPEADRFGTVALKKQLSAYSMNTEMYVAFLFKSLTRVQRDALISKEIPFISSPDQIYLPFLGIMLSNNFKPDKVVSTDKMMPATQSLFLYLIYNNREKPVIKKQAAEALGLTRTSITRASEQLKEMGLITENKAGKEMEMIPVAVGRELFDKARAHLINPVQSVLYLPDRRVDDSTPASGEFSLSHRSDLGYPKYAEYALYKDLPFLKGEAGVDPDLNYATDIVRIQKWKYDPLVFSGNGQVDPVSLICTLADTKDERIHKCLEQVKEEIWTWQII